MFHTMYVINDFTKSRFYTTLRHNFNKDKGEKVSVLSPLRKECLTN